MDPFIQELIAMAARADSYRSALLAIADAFKDSPNLESIAVQVLGVVKSIDGMGRTPMISEACSSVDTEASVDDGVPAAEEEGPCPPEMKN